VLFRSKEKDNPLIYTHLAEVQFAMEQYNDAAENFSNAIQRAPDDPVLYGQRGQTYLSDKKFTKAISDFKAALSLDPSMSTVSTALEQAYGLRYAAWLKKYIWVPLVFFAYAVWRVVSNRHTPDHCSFEHEDSDIHHKNAV